MSQLQTISEILKENEGSERTRPPHLQPWKSLRNQRLRKHRQNRHLALEISVIVAFTLPQVSWAR